MTYTSTNKLQSKNDWLPSKHHRDEGIMMIGSIVVGSNFLYKEIMME